MAVWASPPKPAALQTVGLLCKGKPSGLTSNPKSLSSVWLRNAMWDQKSFHGFILKRCWNSQDILLLGTTLMGHVTSSPSVLWPLGLRWMVSHSLQMTLPLHFCSLQTLTLTMTLDSSLWHSGPHTCYIAAKLYILFIIGVLSFVAPWNTLLYLALS